MSFHQQMLLTGAGFTKNCGGFLGSEMWAKIFNFPAVQKQANIRSLMLSEMDFEVTYHKVMTEEKYSDEDKMVMKTALLDAFEEMTEIVLRHVEGRRIGFSVYSISEWFIDLFCIDSVKKVLWFTLNQDLFLERWFRGWRITSPGAPAFPLSAYPESREQADGRAEHLNNEFSREHFVEIPNQVKMDQVISSIEGGPAAAYVKLHGSYGWLSSDGNEAMVIGAQKTSSIEKESLLKCYKELFLQSINEGNKRLLIIGYGFRDDYINEILINGIHNSGLKIFIARPEEPSKFKEKVLAGSNAEIWSGLSGYFQCSLRDILGSGRPDLMNQIKSAMYS